MDILLICRDGSASSLMTNLLLAMEARKAKSTSSVLFTGEAVAMLVSGLWNWPRGLAAQEPRFKMADNAPALGIPTSGKGESRGLDPRQLITVAKEAGVQLYAGGPWVKLLSLSGKLPAGVTEVDMAGVMKLVAGADRIVGSL